MKQQEAPPQRPANEPDSPAATSATGVYAQMVVHPAHLIRRTYQVFLSCFEMSLGKFDLTPVQWILLATVHDHPGKGIATVASMAAVDKASAGRTVARLADRGLMHVEQNARDHRGKMLALTDAGRTLVAQVMPSTLALHDDLLAQLSPDEREIFLAALRIYVERSNDVSRAPHLVAPDAVTGDPAG